MSSSPEETMQQYLIPEYWDGHSIGVGETERSTACFTLGAVRLAKRTVNEFLETNRTPYPLETYQSGTEIDSDQWVPGSLLYGRREYLRGKTEDATPVSNKNLVLPERPTDLSFTPGGPLDCVGVDGLFYASVKSFFVVANFGREGNRLMPVDMHDIHTTASGVKRAIFAHLSLQKEFTVNRTSHIEAGSDYESLERVGALSLVSRGRLKKKASLAERLGSLGLLPHAR